MARKPKIKPKTTKAADVKEEAKARKPRVRGKTTNTEKPKADTKPKPTPAGKPKIKPKTGRLGAAKSRAATRAAGTSVGKPRPTSVPKPKGTDVAKPKGSAGGMKTVGRSASGLVPRVAKAAGKVAGAVGRRVLPILGVASAMSGSTKAKESDARMGIAMAKHRGEKPSGPPSRPKVTGAKTSADTKSPKPTARPGRPAAKKGGSAMDKADAETRKKLYAEQRAKKKGSFKKDGLQSGSLY